MPFSHTPGVKVPVPFSSTGVQVYPAAIKLLPENRLIPLNIAGPVNDFTVVLDLERGCIRVFGKGVNGHFRYYIFATNGEIFFFQDRGEPLFHKMARRLPVIVTKEKLTLGSSKKLNWDQVKERSKLDEILPVLFSLGQMIPSTGHLLSSDFLEAFNGGFSGILYPEIQEHLGYQTHLFGLNEVYQNIRSRLWNEENNFFLPNILTEFSHGMATSLKTSFGYVDIEWTKGFMRRVLIHAKKNCSISFKFPKGHKSCCLTAPNFKLPLKLSCTLDLRADTKYLLGHFEE